MAATPRKSDVPAFRIALGATGLTVFPLGLGCSRLGSTLSAGGRAQAEKLVTHALDLGINLFDTADIYGQGDSERVLGAALRGRRDEVVLVSKAGQRFTTAQRATSLLKAPLRILAQRTPALRAAIAGRRSAPLPRDYTPEHLRRSIEGSLRRLGTDHLDGFLLHSPSAEHLHHHDPSDLMDRMTASGAIRFWGVSCDDIESLAAALELTSLSLLQLPLKLICSIEGAGLLSAAARRGVGIMARELGDYAGGLQDATSRRDALAAAVHRPATAALIGTTSTAHLSDAVNMVRDLGPNAQ
jgi:aryl-alcohol dehydrogenase-like predicted oxidoreductase